MATESKNLVIASIVVPLPLKDIDTDQIIPAQFLTSVSREGYGENLFRRLKDQDPAFPLSQPQFKGAEILAVDSNFGCGSSREHAVWALRGAGFRAVIAKSFADIFFNNSAKNGLVLVKLPDEDVEEILAGAAAGSYSVSIDLGAQTVQLPSGRKVSFPFDPFRKHCIINGLDDLDYIFSHRDAIDRYRAEQEKNRFMQSC